MDQPSKLTFRALNERIEQLPEPPNVVIEFSAKEKYGYTTALLAIAFYFLSVKVLPNGQWYTLAVATFFAAVEVIAVIVAIASGWPPRPPGFRDQCNEYAEQLDYDFGHYTDLIGWIVQFPRDQIADLADYAEMRQERFREKQPLLVGGVEKLGALPVLIAIATQFRSMHWPPEISWREIVIYLVVACLYWLCLISIGTRHRGKFLEVALKRALIVKDRQAAEGATAEATPVNTCTARTNATH